MIADAQSVAMTVKDGFTAPLETNYPYKQIVNVLRPAICI
jgi:hypothetical protein